jgi:hypothetical protein
MLLLEPQISEVGIRRSDPRDCCLWGFFPEGETGSPFTHVSKSALRTFNQRSIEPAWLQNQAWFCCSAKVTGIHSR